MYAPQNGKKFDKKGGIHAGYNSLSISHRGSGSRILTLTVSTLFLDTISKLSTCLTPFHCLPL